jgi:hypothetical protein
VPAGWPWCAAVDPFTGSENGVRLVFQWFPLDQLASMRVYPSFLAEGLRHLPLTLQHVVHVDT